MRLGAEQSEIDNTLWIHPTSHSPNRPTSFSANRNGRLQLQCLPHSHTERGVNVSRDGKIIPSTATKGTLEEDEISRVF